MAESAIAIYCCIFRPQIPHLNSFLIFFLDQVHCFILYLNLILFPASTQNKVKRSSFSLPFSFSLLPIKNREEYGEREKAHLERMRMRIERPIKNNLSKSFPKRDDIGFLSKNKTNNKKKPVQLSLHLSSKFTESLTH